MRPDEHKQKKNLQYKKKHGIKTGKTPDEEASSGKKKQGHHRKDIRHGEAKRRDGAKPGALAGPDRSKTNSDSSDSDEETDRSSRNKELVYEKKSFSKRKIESNWAKYDLPVASETAETRGGDFSMLLASAGDALAQFRFKDEQDWEDTVSEATETSRVISLDCSSLASAVDCLPLHRRLRVEKNNFTESQVILQDLESQKRLEMYQRGEQDSTEGSNTQESQPASTAKRKTQGELSLTSLAKPSVALDFSQPVVKAGTTEAVQAKNKTVESKVDTSSMEEDLDFLLSLDAPSQSLGSNTNHSSTSNKENMTASSKMTENSTEEKTKSAPAVNTLSTKSGDGSKSGKEEDLEDWLDSVLDD